MDLKPDCMVHNLTPLCHTLFLLIGGTTVDGAHTHTLSRVHVPPHRGAE